MTASGTVRAFRPADLPALYDICLRTGDNGRDATDLYPGDPELLGTVFAAPYAVLEPELTFVVDDGQRAAGYIVGTADTATFVRRLRAEWLPRVSERYPDVTGEIQTPAERVRYLLHHQERFVHPELAEFPAHLHIDLLPSHQRGGFGRALMTRFLDTLTEHGVPGVHLAMGKANTNADAFYRRLGFTDLPIGRFPDIVFFTKKLG
ncbi:MAG TPA: GNAT family N-acetyltransferase [Pseudonocardiaceae bacterium]|nr:GNAT family N-acetyltransferase [Pseudonocardiaceae bacterium]